MLDRFQKYIEEHKLCRKENHILLAVSGGLDSMVMADLFLQTGYRVTFLHCNFQLRGKESDSDEALVQITAEKSSSEFIVKHFATKKFADENQLSIQLAARKLRYEWFHEQLAQKENSVLATAHHLNDELETILLNLVKGTGIKGIAGIPVKQGKIIRPLLFASRDELEQYAQENDIEWREDSSNESLIYQRNFIRHKIVPQMESINPSLMETFRRTSSRLKESKRLVQKYVDEFISKHQQTQGIDTYILKKKLADKNATFLHLLLQKYGINYQQAEEIYKKLKDHSSGAVFKSNGFNINVDRTYLIISKESGNFNLIKIKMSDEGSIGDFFVSKCGGEDFTFKSSKKIASLDYGKLKFPLKVRQWTEGDTFKPLGMKGKKKLSDFMIDNKIAVNLKDRILVIESGNDIVWVVGHRIDDRYKVTDKTKMVYQIEWLDEKSF